MGKIEISTTEAKEQAEMLLKNALDIDSVLNSISFIINEVKTNWYQEATDAHYYTSNLEKDVQLLEQVSKENKEFGNSIVNYVTAAETNSNKTIEMGQGLV